MGFRWEAFSIMKKAKIIIYCAPLFFSALFVMIFHKQLTDHLLAGAWAQIITIAIAVGFISFDIFETRKVKRSSTE